MANGGDCTSDIRLAVIATSVVWLLIFIIWTVFLTQRCLKKYRADVANADALRLRLASVPSSEMNSPTVDAHDNDDNINLSSYTNNQLQLQSHNLLNKPYLNPKTSNQSNGSNKSNSNNSSNTNTTSTDAPQPTHPIPQVVQTQLTQTQPNTIKNNLSTPANINQYQNGNQNQNDNQLIQGSIRLSKLLPEMQVNVMEGTYVEHNAMDWVNLKTANNNNNINDNVFKNTSVAGSGDNTANNSQFISFATSNFQSAGIVHAFHTVDKSGNQSVFQPSVTHGNSIQEEAFKNLLFSAMDEDMMDDDSYNYTHDDEDDDDDDDITDVTANGHAIQNSAMSIDINSAMSNSNMESTMVEDSDVSSLNLTNFDTITGPPTEVGGRHVPQPSGPEFALKVPPLLINNVSSNVPSVHIIHPSKDDLPLDVLIDGGDNGNDSENESVKENENHNENQNDNQNDSGIDSGDSGDSDSDEKISDLNGLATNVGHITKAFSLDHVPVPSIRITQANENGINNNKKNRGDTKASSQNSKSSSKGTTRQLSLMKAKSNNIYLIPPSKSKTKARKGSKQSGGHNNKMNRPKGVRRNENDQFLADKLKQASHSVTFKKSLILKINASGDNKLRDIRSWTYQDVCDWLKNDVLNDGMNGNGGSTVTDDDIDRLLAKYEINYKSGYVLLVLDASTLLSLGFDKNKIQERISFMH